MIFATRYRSPIGLLLIVERNNALIGLYFDGQINGPESITNMVLTGNTPILRQAKNWLDRYFEGEKPDAHELPLAPDGSDFRQRVWKILCTIPYGETVTYGEIAKKLATATGIEKMSAQAIGGAVSHNKISIVIPCHRVIGQNGNLTGYAGGLVTKIKLLNHEGVNTEQMFLPK